MPCPNAVPRPRRRPAPPRVSDADLRSMDGFLRQYIETALWSSTDDEDRPLDDNYGVGDVSAETFARMAGDCDKFRELAGDDIYARDDDDTNAAHDFWLTRNGHGTGFWEPGKWPDEDAADRMDEIAKGFREYYLNVDRGVIVGYGG